MGVSQNGGTPKWMVYNGKPYQNGWFRGTTIFGNTHIGQCIFPTQNHIGQKNFCKMAETSRISEGINKNIHSFLQGTASNHKQRCEESWDFETMGVLLQHALIHRFFTAKQPM